MTTLITKHPNGYVEIAGCPNCDRASYLWFNIDVWRIDMDDGYRGPEVNYCPWCGLKLASPTPPTPSDEPLGLV